jgi:hypothetical protein
LEFQDVEKGATEQDTDDKVTGNAGQFHPVREFFSEVTGQDDDPYE